MSSSSEDRMLETSFENDGYDGIQNGTKWWFAAWGSGPKADWQRREFVHRPPTPMELANADYIVFAFRRGRQVSYKTRTGGLDL